MRANGSLVGVILILDMSKSEEVIKSRLRDWRSIVLRFYGYSEVRIVAVPRFPSSPEEVRTGPHVAQPPVLSSKPWLMACAISLQLSELD